jgi:hypothetical protein
MQSLPRKPTARPSMGGGNIGNNKKSNFYRGGGQQNQRPRFAENIRFTPVLDVISCVAAGDDFGLCRGERGCTLNLYFFEDDGASKADGDACDGVVLLDRENTIIIHVYQMHWFAVHALWGLEDTVTFM